MKLLIVGWDGATYGHLQRIKPPYWSSFGYGGRLLPQDLFLGSYIDSANAWTTITTGVPFEDHRVLMFRSPPMRTEGVVFKTLRAIGRQQWLPGLPRRLLINRVMGPLCKGRGDEERGSERWRINIKGRLMPAISTDIHWKRFWDYLPGPALVFGLPLTYPAFRLDGVLVCGIPAPYYGEARYPTVFPKQMEAEIRGRFRGFYYTEGESPLEHPSQPHLQEYLEAIPKVHHAAIDTFKDLAKRDAYQVGYLLLPIIDDHLHATQEWPSIERAYRLLDETTQDLVEELRPDHVLILSDHGMKPFKRPGMGVKMDHDTREGMWISDLDLGLRRHLDVTPAILKVFGKEFEPSPTVPELEGDAEVVVEDEQEMKEIEDRLRSLGYL